MERFFIHEDHQRVDEYPGGNTSLYDPEPVVDVLGSIEECNAALFTKLVRNQAMSSGIPWRKVDAIVIRDLDVTSQRILERCLCMMLEEWKVEHFFYVRQMTREFSSHQGFYDPVVEYMEEL